MSVLIEREAETAALDRALQGVVRGGPGRVVLIEGPAGIGKTALLVRTKALARSAGLRVLSAAGREPERGFAFGVVGQLLGGKAVTSPSLAPALNGAAPPTFTVLQAMLLALVGLAGDAPLVAVVDNLQWADEASRRFTDFLAHRVPDLALLLVLAGRPATAPLLDVPGDALTLRPEPLSPDAVHGMMAGAPGAAGAGLAAGVHALSGGNPLLVEELRRSLDRRGVDRDSIYGDIRRHLGLGEATRAVAEAVAILGPGARLADVATLTGRDRTSVADAADQLLLGGILRGPALSFTQPLVEQSVRAGIPDAQRALRHRRAAQLLEDAGAGVRAVGAQLHRAAPEGDDWVTARLRAAAEAAVDDGDLVLAAALLRRALDEPPPATDRVAVLLELGIVQARLGDPEAMAPLDEAAARAAEPWMRVGAAVARSRLLSFRGRGDEAVDSLEPLATGPEAEDRELALRLNAEIIDAAWSRPLWSRRLAALDRFAAIARPEDALWPVLPVSRGFDLMCAGTPAEEIEALVVQPLSGGRLLRAASADAPIVALGVVTLLLNDRPDLAFGLIESALADARRRGSSFAETHMRCYRAVAELRYGSVMRARSEAEAALATIRERRFDIAHPLALALQAEALLDLESPAVAGAALDEGPDPDAVADTPFAPFLFGAHARVALALGQPERAAARARRAAELMGPRGWRSPALVPWRTQLAEAIAGEDRGEALRLAAEELEIARVIGRPRTIGMAQRTLAQLEPDATRDAALSAAVATLADSPARLERARTLLALGRLRLDAGGDRHDVREVLTLALDEAAGCAASGLEAQIRNVLRHAGGKPRRPRATGPESLTASERRVAELAAQGATNREIARDLYLSIKTVESHLSSTFRKLDVTSRHELRARLPHEAATIGP